VIRQNELISEEVVKSDSIMKYFTAALMRDKLIMFMLFLCMIAIVGIVVVAILKKKQTTVVINPTSFEAPIIKNSTTSTLLLDLINLN